MSACARDVEPAEPEGIQMTFTAYQEGHDATKSTVLDGGTQVYWEPGDEIKVFFNGSSGRFISQNAENATSATFTGTLPVVVGGNEGAGITTKTWGLYPYRADAVLDGDAMVTTLPAAQTGRAGSFAKNTNITLAHSEGYGLAFYNVCGGLRFSLTQEGIKRITFEGNNGEALAGKIKIAFEDGGVPVVGEVVAKDSVLTLTAPNGGTFQTGVWYYISALPGPLSGGYKMVFYKETESAKLTSTSSVRFKRGIFGSLANADDGLVFLSQDAVDLGLSVSWGSCNIGANWPEEAGGHYQWAGLTDVTSTSIYLDWDNCPYHTGTSNITGWTKYILSAHASHWSGEGAPDNKTVLDPEDDIAHVTLGDDWRMPTKEEWAELLDPDNCYWVKTRYNGVNGYLVTSKKAGYTDKSIFLPAVGNRDHDIFTKQETGGFYWSSSLYESISRWGWSVVFDGDTLGLYAVGRYGARAVRPVKGSGSGSSGNIQFADPIAKYACVEKFDTNGDGEVSYAEAAAATSLTGLFTNWNTVTSFEEIRYFTGVTSTSGVFTGLNKLTHITIPDNITTLGTFQNCTSLESVVLPESLESLPAYCFDGCSSLTDVTLPTGLTAIPNSAFRNCTSLAVFDVPSALTSIGDYAFSYCTVLTGVEMPVGLRSIGYAAFSDCKAIACVEFPASLTSIGIGAFSGCTALTSVTLVSGVSVGRNAFSGCTALASVELASGVSVGQNAFGGCTALYSVVLPADMITIPDCCFQDCTALASVTWPSALTSIGNYAFDGCRFEGGDYSLTLPSSVTTIGSNAFGYLRHLIIPSTSPVSIQSGSFKADYTYLYVPSNMVEMYKVRTNWSNYADRIRPISDYPIGVTVGGTVGEAVDLGLSVKWASWNVGASAPEDYGAHFAWGETESKEQYNWVSYICCNGSSSTLTLYNTSSSYGKVDNKTTLDPVDDAAHVNWGGNWRMPTDAEWTELMNYCTWTRTTENGVNGRRVTSNKEGYTDKSIFLPAAGSRNDTVLYDVGSLGAFWSSSLDTGTPYFARDVYFRAGDVQHRFGDYRFYGLSVRPVCE